MPNKIDETPFNKIIEDINNRKDNYSNYIFYNAAERLRYYENSRVKNDFSSPREEVSEKRKTFLEYNEFFINRTNFRNNNFPKTGVYDKKKVNIFIS